MWTYIRQKWQEIFGDGKKSVSEEWKGADEHDLRVARLRQRGVRIGEGCRVHTEEFSTEPYLIELGRNVAVAAGTQFITHDGSIRLARNDKNQNIQHVGRIIVGDNTYIGQSCMLLSGARVGSNCIIGAGSVVRGRIPDNSVVVGNPARVVGQASLIISRLLHSPDTVESLQLSETERRAFMERHFGIVPENNQS